MHDIDGTLLRGVQSEWETDNESEWESESAWGTQDEFEFEADDEFEFEMGMDTEESLAYELLTQDSEAEMEQFLGNVIRGAARRAVPLARQAGRFLFNTAKPHLKQAWTGIGNDLINKGTDAARRMVDRGANRLSGELPAVPANRASLNVARKVVQAAQTVGKQMARLPPTAPPSAVKAILSSAAQRYLPSGTANVAGKRGTWVRKGNRIILLGI